jgi:hypothetical protein
MIKTRFDQEGQSSASDAHKIALELMKQLITLSSGILALSATFIGQFKTESLILKIVLMISWISLALAVFFGLQTISAIVKSRLNSDFDWSTGEGKTYASASKYSFLAGIIFFAGFAFSSILNVSPCP